MTLLPVQDHERPLAGAEKIAAVLLALDREASSRILKHFDTRELREIARTAARLKTVPSVVLEEICAGLVEAIDNGEPDLIGGQMVIESLLSSALPDEQVADIMSGVRRGSNKFIWQKVATLPDQHLADYLAAEHPQMIAVVLARIDPPVAARILALLPASLRSQAMRRMLIAKPVAEEILHLLEESASGGLVCNGRRAFQFGGERARRRHRQPARARSDRADRERNLRGRAHPRPAIEAADLLLR